MMDETRPLLGLRLSTVALTIAAVLTAPHQARAADFGANKSELVRGLLPTVVNISVKKEQLQNAAPAAVGAEVPAAAAGPTVKTFVGSGFIIDAAGVIVTNYHVVEDAFEITVTLSDGTRLAGKRLSASRTVDLALVKVETEHPLAAAHWDDSDSLQVGDQVFAVGNPFGIGLSLSSGIVSGLNRNIQDSPLDDFIQTDAPINHGNSGGPLFDMQGGVVGVNSTIISPSAGSVGLGFAIPSNVSRFVVEQLRTYGWVRPGWIGVKLQQVTPEDAVALGMARPEGSIVSWVLPNGPAKRAGLAIGDVILRFAGSTPSDERALLRDIAHTPGGNTVLLVVRRGGEELNIPITVETWPRTQWEALDAPRTAQRPKIIVPPDLGLSLGVLDAEKRATSGLQPDVPGVLVTNVVAGSDSAQRGMASGDIILRVQDLPVATPEDVQSGIDAAHASKRDFLLMLVVPKVRKVAGPKWMALKVGASAG
jgi:serine protease Do